MKTKKFKIAIILIIILLIALTIFLIGFNKNKTELKSINSKKELKKIYYGSNNYSYNDSIFLGLLAMPFTLFDSSIMYDARYPIDYSIDTYNGPVFNSDIDSIKLEAASPVESSSSASKDYSKTNIQVENVDEADITKTDGDYIYSLSENNVIITDVRNPEDVKIASKISLYGSAPEDLLLYDNKLVVIYANTNTYSNTTVEIYDISNREDPLSIKSYTLYEPYYTSRCIDNNLYVISSGRLRMENDEIATYYTENSQTKEINLKNIQYLTNVESDNQTLISKVDLNNTSSDISVNSYLIDISNSYVSENSIYLLDYNYGYNYNQTDKGSMIASLFGYKGVLGLDDNAIDTSDPYTEIYKFDILSDGSIKYSNKAKAEGQTINQYSLDEFDGNLRIALYNNNGSHVVVFDNTLKLLGESAYVAKGEKMYSSRFIGNKVYFVTFKNMDPLFVMDLSNPSTPKVLGELKIPGYSTYLHPYDENHLIGIGMETEEQVYRDYNGKVRSTSSRITGMKMALFDVSDVTHPKEISKTVIGDRRTTSAILTNPKALLFSKEKELIAIPANNLDHDFSMNYLDNTESLISSYSASSRSYLSEGYLVYKINLNEGFNLKGIIQHENTKSHGYYSTNSRLLRGLYIDNNLYTISETTLKVNDLDTLEQISELKIIDNTNKENVIKGVN